MNAEEVRALPAAVDLATAGRAFSIGRTKAYALAKADEFPVPVLRVGNAYRVRRADLLSALGILVSFRRNGTAPKSDEIENR